MTRNALIDFFVRNLYATKMLSFINLERKKCSDIIFSLLRSSEVKDQGAKCKPSYDVPSKVYSNCMPIWYHFQYISPFNNLRVKLINLITMV